MKLVYNILTVHVYNILFKSTGLGWWYSYGGKENFLRLLLGQHQREHLCGFIPNCYDGSLPG